MSVVVKCKTTGKVYAFVKGADSSIKRILKSGQDHSINNLLFESVKFQSRGLRTLLFAMRELDSFNAEMTVEEIECDM